MPAINATMRKLIEQDKQFVLNSLTKVFANYKACAAKGHPGVQRSRVTLDGEWPAPADAEGAARNKIGTDLFSDCRDMTQNVQNLLKAVGYGADLTQFGLQQTGHRNPPPDQQGAGTDRQCQILRGDRG